MIKKKINRSEQPGTLVIHATKLYWRKTMKIFFAILLLLPLLVWSTLRTVNDISFNKNCEGYLKRAADANTVSQAKTELERAIKYMEENGLTHGYTSLVYKTPDEDVEFWYNNIKSAKTELEKVTDKTTPLERTNMLMKLRETLLDGEGGKNSVTVPPGISLYPNNVIYFLGGLLSLFALVGSCVLWYLATK